MILRETTTALGPASAVETAAQTMTNAPTTLDPLPARDQQMPAAAPLLAAVCEQVKTVNAPCVVRFKSVSELEQFVPQWEVLVAAAADANIFYEPWMLLPALRTFHSDRDFSFVLVFGPDPERPSGAALLYGFFPFERRSKYRGVPCSVLKLIKHKYMELCTPLVRRDVIGECVAVLLDWIESGASNSPLVEFRFLAGEDRATQEILSQIYQRRTVCYQSECSARALFRPAADAEVFLNFALAGKRRKEFRRLEKRVAETGRLEYKTLLPSESPTRWIKDFLELEGKGWKGKEGSAMALQDDRRHFFEEISFAAHQRGKLMMLGLFLDDRPLALKCNFLTGHGSFAFKIAFDEEFARSSPGVLLELENVRQLHNMRQLSWMDSCAIPKHFMINRLWPERRTLETFIVSTGRAPGSLLVSLLPLMRWVKRTAKSFSGPFPQE